MQIGMIGLGRMGSNMVRRLIRKGHSCVVFNRSPQPVNELVKENAIGDTSLAEVGKKLTRPRATQPEPGITAGKLMQRYISRWFDSVCAPPQRTFTQNLASCNSTCRDEKRLRTERMLTQSKTSGRKIPPKAKNHEDGLTARIETRHSPGFGGSTVAMFDWRKGLVAGHRLLLRSCRDVNASCRYQLRIRHFGPEFDPLHSTLLFWLSKKR